MIHCTGIISMRPGWFWGISITLIPFNMFIWFQTLKMLYKFLHQKLVWCGWYELPKPVWPLLRETAIFTEFGRNVSLLRITGSTVILGSKCAGRVHCRIAYWLHRNLITYIKKHGSMKRVPLECYINLKHIYLKYL